MIIIIIVIIIKAGKFFVSFLATLLDGQHIKQIFLCSLKLSDSEKMTALQTVETVIRTRRHHLDAD